MATDKPNKDSEAAPEHPTPHAAPSDTRHPPPQSYEVGYGKPPTHTRFKKGHSGNPRGRPKGVPNLVTDLKTVLGQKITVRENGRDRTVTKQYALVAALIHKALKGDIAAGRLLLNHLWPLQEPPSTDPGKPLGADDADVLQAYLQRHRPPAENNNDPDSQ